MSRLYSQPVSDATGQTAQLFAALKAAAGKVPNLYADMGANSPAALGAAMHMDGALRKSSLSAKDIEVIKLAVSEHAGCDYCLAAHTLFSGKAGFSAEAIMAARKGGSIGDARLDALADFTRTLVKTSGTLPAEAVAAVKAAGVTDAQLTDLTLAVASITLTNLFNRINDTVLDFPSAAA